MVDMAGLREPALLVPSAEFDPWVDPWVEFDPVVVFTDSNIGVSIRWLCLLIATWRIDQVVVPTKERKQCS